MPFSFIETSYDRFGLSAWSEKQLEEAMEACYVTLQNEAIISLKRVASKYLQLKGKGTGSSAATPQNQHFQRATNLAQVP
jgi:hypothetical protein